MMRTVYTSCNSPHFPDLSYKPFFLVGIKEHSRLWLGSATELEHAELHVIHRHVESPVKAEKMYWIVHLRERGGDEEKEKGARFPKRCCGVSVHIIHTAVRILEMGAKSPHPILQAQKSLSSEIVWIKLISKVGR